MVNEGKKGTKWQRHPPHRLADLRQAQRHRAEGKKTGNRYQWPRIRGQLETGDWQNGEPEGG